MKIGLLGGVFNPVHFGHIRIATLVQQQLCFDHIYFVPSSKPPHKNIKTVIPAIKRCEMLIRALPNKLPFSLSQIELNRKGKSYAIDTVNHFKSKLISSEDSLSFILGLDAFLELHTWKAYKTIVKKTNFVVVSRHNKHFKKHLSSIKILQNYIAKKLPWKYSFFTFDSHWESKSAKLITYFKIKPNHISSTLIRKKIKNGKNITKFVPQTVANYIKNEGLYL